MCGNVVADAVTVLTLVIALEHSSVISVGAGLASGGVVGSVAWAFALWPKIMSDRRLRTVDFVRRHFMNRYGLMIFLSRFDWPIFAAAVMLAGSLTSATVLGLSTMLYVLFVDRLTRAPGTSQQDYHHVRHKDILMMLVALGGMTMVLLSQDAGWAPNGAALTLAGIGVAVMTAFSSAASAARFPSGHRIYNDIRLSGDGRRWRDECAATLLAMGIGSVPTALVMLSVAAVTGNLVSISGWAGLGSGFLVGALLPTTGVMLGSATNLTTRNLGINAIAYFVPLASILVLIAAGKSNPVTLWLAVAGGLVIAFANIGLAGRKQTADTVLAEPLSAAS